jgi:transcriptional regulator with XRE-family HTH domain
MWEKSMSYSLQQKKEEILIYKEKLLNNINKLVYKNGWTIHQFSEKSNIPYETVKKLLSGKINNPGIYTLIKISQSFGCGIDYLIGMDSAYGFVSSNLPQRTFTLLQEIANFEIYLHEQNKKNHKNEITTLVPTGILHDGMLFDSAFIESTDISAYNGLFDNIIMCGLKITGKKFHPTYLDGDVLLIARDRFPQCGEIGVFLLGNKAYIRKYTVTDHILLESLNGFERPIKINNIDELHFFGRVLTIVRN